MAIFSLFTAFSGAYAWFQSIIQDDNNNEDFYSRRYDSPVLSISIHEFYGETADGNSFAFNPNGVVVYDAENGSYSSRAVELNEYSIEKPNHPVLILFENDTTQGYQTQINMSTDYAFLGSNDDFINAKLKNKQALNDLSNKQNGYYYQVTKDESQDNQIYLYKYVNNALTSVTYETYASLETNVEKDVTNAGNYYRVQNDEDHGGVATVYQYVHATREFEMVWCDLGNLDYNETNPLSSAVQFHSFAFTGTLASMTTSEDVMVESFNSTTATYTYEEDSLSCIALAKSDFTNTNKSSFTNFSAAETFQYNKQVTTFSGDVTGVTYIGIVVNYDQLALEYIFSRYLGHDALNAGLAFKCDWRTEF